MDRPEMVDALVIGRGFGGTVAALRLGQAGYTTLVLERGKRWPLTERQETFATYEKPDGRAAWLSNITVDPIRPNVAIERYTGILDRLDGEGISVLSGVGVGGGSLVFTGAMIEPSRALFLRLFPDLDYPTFHEIYYPRVRAIIRPTPIPPDLLQHPHFEAARAFLAWARHAGLPTDCYDMAVDWARIRDEIEGKAPPHVTTGQEMWYGLNSGARLSVDRTYLAQAKATQRVEILPLHLVTAIQAESAEGKASFVVSGERLNTSGTVLGTFAIRCTSLFVAAGSSKTSELLVRAKATNTLPRLNEYTGQGWGNNGESVGFHTGPAMTTTTPQIPGGVGALYHHDTHGIIRLLGNVLNEGGTSRMCSLALAFPSQGVFPRSGSFHAHPETGRVSLHWPKGDAAIKHLGKGVRKAYAYVDRLQCTAAHTACTTKLQTNMTMHPLGGMVLGKACHLDGRVAGYHNLYVIDGSFLPGSSAGANPALTIAALAESIMDQFLGR